MSPYYSDHLISPQPLPLVSSILNLRPPPTAIRGRVNRSTTRGSTPSHSLSIGPPTSFRGGAGWPTALNPSPWLALPSISTPPHTLIRGGAHWPIAYGPSSQPAWPWSSPFGAWPASQLPAISFSWQVQPPFGARPAGPHSCTNSFTGSLVLDNSVISTYRFEIMYFFIRKLQSSWKMLSLPTYWWLKRKRLVIITFT